MSAAPVQVTVDAGATSQAFPRAIWQGCVGSGHAQLGTRVDWREHMQKAVHDLGITGVRMHGWLDDDMSVAPAVNSYHFYNVDVVADYLVTLGVRPVMELDYMPRALARCQTGMHDGGTSTSPSAAEEKCTYAFHNRGGYKGLIEPPADYAQWQSLIHALSKHLLDRHGIETLRQWRFEVWNEPNWWIGHVRYPQEYVPLYNASAIAIKATHAELRVGGPATATLEYIEDFATRATWTGTRPRMPVDFVSSHFYPSEKNCSDASQPLGRDPDCFVRSVRRARARVASARAAVGAPPLPFLLTEFNSGLQGGPGTGEAGPHLDTACASAGDFEPLPPRKGWAGISHAHASSLAASHSARGLASHSYRRGGVRHPHDPPPRRGRKRGHRGGPAAGSARGDGLVVDVLGPAG